MTRDEAVQKQIDEIMDWFDFARVHTVMTSLQWEWVGIVGVPSEPQIRAHARQGLVQAADRRCSGATGGFCAEYREGTDPLGSWVNLSLSFVVESWDSDGLNYEEKV